MDTVLTVFDGFEARDLPTERGTIHAMVGGEGPPLLLLHGYPQTHLMWHAARRCWPSTSRSSPRT